MLQVQNSSGLGEVERAISSESFQCFMLDCVLSHFGRFIFAFMHQLVVLSHSGSFGGFALCKSHIGSFGGFTFVHTKS